MKAGPAWPVGIKGTPAREQSRRRKIINKGTSN